jgi:hypothetical protein
VRFRSLIGLSLAGAILVGACGGDSDDDATSSTEASAEAPSADDGGAASSAEMSTIGALGLDVPDAVPADVPVPADSVVLSTVESGQAGERLDVEIGTFASREVVTAALGPYVESLENGSFSDPSGQGFVDVDGTLTQLQFFVSTTDSEDPPTRILIAVPNG